MPCSGKEKKFLLAVVALDMLAVGLIVPLLTPFMRETLGASPSTMGMMGSLYGIVQLISGPFVGIVSDRFDRKQVLIICVVVGAFGYGLLGAATSLFMVFVSRVVVGVVRQTQTLAKAWLSDITTSSTQMKDLSHLSAAISVGFMIGPMCGGYVAKNFGYRVPFFIAVALFFVNAGIIMVFLQNPPGIQTKAGFPEKKSKTDTSSEEKSFLSKFASLKWSVQKLMIIKLFMSCGVIMFRANVFMLLEFHHDDLDVAMKGKIISFFSIISVLAQIVFVGPLTKGFSAKQLLIFFPLCLAGSCVGMAVTKDLVTFALFLALMATASAVVKVTMTTLIANSGGKGFYGEVLGVAGSVVSICRAGAPAINGVLVEKQGVTVPVFLAAFCFLAVTILSPCLVEKDVTSASTEEERFAGEKILKQE